MDAERYLTSGCKRWLERAFAAPLDGIRVHLGRAAARIVREAGGRFGCAVEGRVFLGDAPPRLRARVLLHELAHAAQQRRPGPAAPMAVAEREARSAEACVAAGGRHPIRLAADPRDPALWGEAGHYYTVYFVALAAGAPKQDAYRIAFWAQVPDEVEDFDAKAAGFEWAKLEAKGAGKGLIPAMPIFGPLIYPFTQSPKDIQDKLKAQQWWEAVQRGLHCLSGRSAEREQEIRKGVSTQYVRPEGNRLIEFGVSLHAFGDSFAHSVNGRMPPPPLGHAPWGTSPDRLSIFREKIYLDYVGALHDVLTTVYPAPNKPRLSRQETVAALDTVIPPIPKVDYRCFLSDDEAKAWERAYMPGTAANPPMGSAAFRTMCDRDVKAYNAVMTPGDEDERKQIQAIRQLAAARMEAMVPYDPENKDALWLNAYKPPPDVGWYPGVEKLVFGLIKRWAALK